LGREGKGTKGGKETEDERKGRGKGKESKLKKKRGGDKW